jgi:hypothetical protein
MWGETKGEIILLTWCTCYNVSARKFPILACTRECIKKELVSKFIFAQIARQLY